MKFVPWLRTKTEEMIAQGRSTGELGVLLANLGEIQRALDGQVPMLFGAVISNHVAVLKRELGPWVDAEEKKLADELAQGVLSRLGVSAPSPRPTGFLASVRSFFRGGAPAPSAPSPSTSDESAALAYAKVAGLGVLPLLSHADPNVRRLAATALGESRWRSMGERLGPRIEGQLEDERDERVARALLDVLAAWERPLSARCFEVIAARFPALKPVALVLQFSTEASMREAAARDDLRLALLRALAEPGAARFPAVRNELLADGLRSKDETVHRVAVAGVRRWKLRAELPRVLELAKTGLPEALETLGELSADQPAAGFELLVANAKRTPPVLTGLALMLGARRFTTEQLAALESLLPLVSDEAITQGIRQHLERQRPSVVSAATGFAALEDAIDRQPDDPKPWLVWSDALQGTGDPRGELVALAHAGKPVEEALERAIPQLAPELTQWLEPKTVRESVGLHMGLPKKVTFRFVGADASVEQLITAFLASRLGRFVTEVELGLTSETGDDNDWAPAIEALQRVGQNVRSLMLGAFEYPEESEISWVQWGDLSGVWSLPALQHLHVRGGDGELGDVRSPTLESLFIETGSLHQPIFDRLLSADLPALSSLRLWTGDPTYGGDTGVDDARALLDWAPPSLRRLGLENCAYTHELIPLLAGHPLTRQLTHLSLAKGVLRPTEVDLVCSHAAAFQHLAVFDLSENLLEDDDVARLKVALPNLVAADQREDYGAEDGDEGDRYVAVGE